MDEKVKSESPVFEIILDELNIEMGKLDESSRNIFDRICKLYDIRQPNPMVKNDELKAAAPSPNTKYDEFKLIINRFKYLNNRLLESNEGLRKITG
jgi:hypothetical protein